MLIKPHIPSFKEHVHFLPEELSIPLLKYLFFAFNVFFVINKYDKCGL